MRTLISATALAFALGTLVPSSVYAGEGGCAFGGHSVKQKKNDFEAPPPANVSVSPTPNKG